MSKQEDYLSDEEQLAKLLSNRYRRLHSGKLYKIKDKAGRKVEYIPNETQKQFYDPKQRHYLNIILKARQLWVSTAFCIDALDYALFSSNKNIGIIAQDLNTAEYLFHEKIKFVYDNLPDRLKQTVTMKTDRAREIVLSNGSRIVVDNSFRWGTFQYMHISEFGKICIENPYKAREIVTGALNTVSPGQYVSIESTAEGNSGYFFDMCERARRIQKMGQGLSKLDYNFWFFPRYEEPSYTLNDDKVEITEDMKGYFVSLYNEHNIFLTDAQKNRYAKKEEEQQEDMMREYPSTPDEAFNLAIKGAYFEKEITKAMKEGRMDKVEYDPALSVNTARDLWGAWGGDDTAIRFFQLFGKEIRVIDYREGSWYSMEEIIESQIKTRNYRYGTHIWPHDMKVHEYSSGKTRFLSAYQLGLQFRVLPLSKVSDGIDAVRSIFPNVYIDYLHCKKGVDKLNAYRRSYDQKNWVLREKPAKNGCQHAADAFRYMAIGIIEPVRREDYRAQAIDYSSFWG